MFLPVSGHSSELSIANHSPQSTVSQLKCVSNTISSWFENHQPQMTKISTVIYAPFIQNSSQMTSRLTATTSFPRVFFQLLQFSRQRPSFSARRHTDDKYWLDFSSIFFKICRFRSSVLLSLQVFTPRGATLESVARFSSTNLLRVVTNDSK